jgi:hypothetical protein
MRKEVMLLPAMTAFLRQFVSAQLSPSAAWAAHAPAEYQVFPNLTCLVASNYEAKLDIYQRRAQTTPQPTIIHAWRLLGGGHERSVSHVASAVV